MSVQAFRTDGAGVYVWAISVLVMSTETADVGGTELLNTTPKRVLAGVVGGFVGSLLMGAIMSTMNPGTLNVAIPAMYGVEGPSATAGWALHGWHGVVLGAVYVLGVENIGAVRERARTAGGAIAGGVGYGVLTTLLPVLVMPLWLTAVGFGNAPPFPNIGFPATAMSAVTHVVYAVPVGIAYYLVAREG
jgi:hypothetical protein